jgi:hypothetical protein
VVRDACHDPRVDGVGGQCESGAVTNEEEDSFGRLLEGVARGSLELFHRLSPAGREFFRTSVEAMLRSGGNMAALEALYAVDYERIPPDPLTFLTHSDYCGHVGKELWAPWRPHFLKVCDPASGVYEVIATGAMGLGKTSWAMLVNAFKIGRLGHLRDPALFYGLPHKAKIVFGLYAITKNLVKQVGFYDLRDIIIDQSPFFRDVMPRLPFGKEFIRWPQKNIEVVTGSNELHAIGQNLFAVVADELNYYNQGEKTAAKANELVAEVSRRLESRFVGYGGEIPGIAIFISQTRTTTDFLELRIREKKTAPGCLVVRGPRWAFCPKGYERIAEQVKREPKLAGKTKASTPLGPVPAFRVYLGDETHDGRVLDSVVKRDDGTYLVEPINPDEPEPSGRILAVPVIHYRAFLDDLHGSLRALADEPTGTFTPFFPRREVIEQCFDEELIFPFARQEIPCYEGQPGKLADAFDHELVTRVHMGRRVPIRRPEAPRYLHFDLSQGGDRTGLAMVHPRAHYQAVRPARDAEDDSAQVGESELVKEVEVDFYIALTAGPSGEPIDYRRARAFIEWLRRLGYWIKWATADQYMSFDHLMRLRDTGVSAEVVSCDKTSRPYRDLRQCAIERRLWLPFPPGARPDPVRATGRTDALTRVILFQELCGLEHDVRSDKVDHRQQNPDGTKGSKDVADGLAGAVHKCLTDEVAVGQDPERKTYQQRQASKLNRYMQEFRYKP